MADAQPEPKRIVAKPVHQVGSAKTSNRRLWAEVCYFYPQYTLQEASKLPYRDILLLLKTANAIRAENYYNLTQIAAAPYTKKGSGVKKLTEHFQKEMRK